MNCIIVAVFAPGEWEIIIEMGIGDFTHWSTWRVSLFLCTNTHKHTAVQMHCRVKLATVMSSQWFHKNPNIFVTFRAFFFFFYNPTPLTLLRCINIRVNSTCQAEEMWQTLVSLWVFVVFEQDQTTDARRMAPRDRRIYTRPLGLTGTQNQRCGVLISDSYCSRLNSIKDIEVNGLPAVSRAK